MRIWEVMYDQDYENVIYKDNKYFDFFDKNFKGEEISSCHETIEIETSFKGIKAEKGELADIISLGTKPIFTEKVVELLKSKLGANIQYIKLRHQVYGDCYAVNVINVLDCVDEERSIIQRMSSGKIFRISKYVFKEDILYSSIFKITTDRRIGVFVTDDFVKDIENYKITGLKCKLIWDSDNAY